MAHNHVTVEPSKQQPDTTMRLHNKDDERHPLTVAVGIAPRRDEGTCVVREISDE
ncbi:hypothetical protein [Flindersiella endophytica]